MEEVPNLNKVRNRYVCMKEIEALEGSATDGKMGGGARTNKPYIRTRTLKTDTGL